MPSSASTRRQESSSQLSDVLPQRLQVGFVESVRPDLVESAVVLCRLEGSGEPFPAPWTNVG